MTQREITQIVVGQATTDGAGVRLTRLLGTQQLDMLDPFLMLDNFYSDDPKDYIAGFPDHPHRGFETVTYMLAGAMKHGDHMGISGHLKAGSVQWMTAGRGVIHSEMPEQEDGLLSGFQLWVNLPAAEKMTPARYQDIPPEEIPVVEPGDGVRVKVIAGAFQEVRGPISGVATEPLMLDVFLPAGTSATVPLEASHNSFVHVFEGRVRFGESGRKLRSGQLGVLGPGASLHARSAAGGRFLLLAGRPLREPVARYGPFVMNTREELMRAFEDYRLGRLTD